MLAKRFEANDQMELQRKILTLGLFLHLRILLMITRKQRIEQAQKLQQRLAERYEEARNLQKQITELDSLASFDR